MSSSKNPIHKQYSLAACEFGHTNTTTSSSMKIKHHIHNLFEMIDKEIDSLINENILLKERIETLEELIENPGTQASTTTTTTTATTGSTVSTTTALHSSIDTGGNLINRNNLSQQKPYNYHQVHHHHQQQQQPTPFSVSSVKRDSMVAASQLSQKIKSTYKLKTSSKIFKGQSNSSSSHLIGTYEWHKDGIWYITSSQKNGRQYIATASADSTINICDVTRIDYNLTPCVIYAGHQSSVNCVKFHHNNDLVLTASGDGTSHLWRFNPDFLRSDYDEMGEEPTIIKTPLHELGDHHNVVVSCDWMSGLDQCVTASWDQMANIYDYQTGELIVQLAGHDQALTDVCACESTRLIVTSSHDTTFRLWDFRDAIHSVSVFQGHNRSVTSTCFLGADKILSGGDDRNVKVWDLKNMRSPLITISMESGINKLSVSQQHNLFTIPLDNRNVRIYDINGNRICRLSRDSHNRMVTCATWLNNQSPIMVDPANTNCSTVTSTASNVIQQSQPPPQSSTSAATSSTSMIMSPPPPPLSKISDANNTYGGSDFFTNNNTLTLFTCAFDRRVCAWNVVIEK